MWFAYLPGPETARLAINGLPYPIVNAEAGCCNFLGTTFQVSSHNVSGLGGLARTETLDATLTTDAQGQVLAWTFTGSDQTRFRTILFASSYQAGVFEEWIQLRPDLSWVAEGPVYSSGPGTWVMSAGPIPEASSAALLAVGLAGIGVVARRRRQWPIRAAVADGHLSLSR